jgi:hypothetical protein
MITRRGLFGMLAAFASNEPMLTVNTDANGPVHVHEHKWAWSPYLVIELQEHHGPDNSPLTPIQVCSVAGCGMLRIRGGELDAGKAFIEDK